MAESSPYSRDFQLIVGQTLVRLQIVFSDVTPEEQRKGHWIYVNRVINNHTWTKTDYATRGFQKEYCARIFKRQAQLAYENIWHMFQFLNYGTDTTQWSVLSLGCGPGSDLLGIKIALEQRFGESNQRTYHGIDAVSEWQDAFNMVDTNFRFYNRQINEEYIENMPPADVIVVSYMYYSGSLDRTITGQPNNDKLYQQGLSLRKLDEKARRIVIVIDTTDKAQRVVFEEHGFQTILTNDSTGRSVFVHFKVKNFIPKPNQIFQRAHVQSIYQPQPILQPTTKPRPQVPLQLIQENRIPVFGKPFIPKS